MTHPKIDLFMICYGGLHHHPANFDLKMCKLPTPERRAATTDSDRDDLSAHRPTGRPTDRQTDRHAQTQTHRRTSTESDTQTATKQCYLTAAPAGCNFSTAQFEHAGSSHLRLPLQSRGNHQVVRADFQKHLGKVNGHVHDGKALGLFQCHPDVAQNVDSVLQSFILWNRNRPGGNCRAEAIFSALGTGFSELEIPPGRSNTGNRRFSACT